MATKWAQRTVIRVNDYVFSDAADLVPTDEGWEYAVYQLNRGPFGYRVHRFELPGLVFEWYYVQASVAVHEVKNVDDLAIVIPLEGSAPSLFGGQEIGFGRLFKQSRGNDFCHRTEPGAYTLTITISRRVADQFGWPEDPNGLAVVSCAESMLKRILSRIEAAVRALELLSGGALGARRDQYINSLVSAIDDMMCVFEEARSANDLSRVAMRNMTLVTEVHGRLLAGDVTNSEAVDDLANLLGVSRRTLFRAMNASIGMAPRAYLKRLRLHLVRDVLSRTAADSASVTDIAMAHGFWHLGRFSQDFRELFGSTPSQALRTPVRSADPPTISKPQQDRSP